MVGRFQISLHETFPIKRFHRTKSQYVVVIGWGSRAVRHEYLATSRYSPKAKRDYPVNHEVEYEPLFEKELLRTFNKSLAEGRFDETVKTLGEAVVEDRPVTFQKNHARLLTKRLVREI